MESFGTPFGTNSGNIAVTAAALFAFGVAYNWLVIQLNRRGYDDGYTWLLVVVGVGVTVGVSGFTIGWPAALLLFVYFAASGLPMATGNIYRHVKARRVERE